jgi:hypothetical protein
MAKKRQRKRNEKGYRQVAKEINKVQKISPACIATDIASCSMVEVREQNWFII